MYSPEAWLFVAQEEGFHRKCLQFAIDFMAHLGLVDLPFTIV